MPRGLSSTIITELEKDDIRLAGLIYMDIGSGQYLTDYAHDLVAGGVTYTSSTHLLSVGAPRESRDLRVNTVSVTLSGVQQTYLTLFLTNDHVNRQVKFSKALVDDDGAVIGDSILAFDGRITRFEIKESSRTSEITIEVASHWADFEKTAGRLTNTNSQQRFFPNDLGFAYAANTIRDLRWGRK
jgi:hypothetical protein